MIPPLEPPDPLTGLSGRLSCDAFLKEELEKALDGGTPLAVIVADLDHFKSINDSFGHARGDTVLTEFGQRVQAIIRTGDRPFRYGGDEFVLVLPQTNLPKAQVFAERLLEAVHRRLFTGDPSLTLTLSGGIACFPEDACTPAELLAVADRRMYLAKRAGRARVSSTDRDESEGLPAGDGSRLIERDLALEIAKSFLGGIRTHERSVMVLSGRSGSGRSRLLSEISTAAQMHGFTILSLSGSYALGQRTLGAWLEARSGLDLPSPSSGRARFIQAIRSALALRGAEGLLITVDDPHFLDQPSVDFLHSLYSSQELPCLAVIYTDENQPHLLFGEVEQSRIDVVPLSLTGVQVWLRHYLFWEAPVDFISWLHKQTEGLPGLLKRGLDLLVTLKILVHFRGTWNCQPDFADLPLADLLARPTYPLTNLPAGQTPLVGRSAEIRELLRLTRTGRLVTLAGPGGIGKSRLAIQVAAERQQDFMDGVFFVPLAAVSTVEFILPALAEAMSFRFTSQGSLKEQWLAYIRPRRVLLVLDNFEHLQDGAPLLEELLQQSAGLGLLVTSRVPLGLSDERLLELGGLSVPPMQAASDVFEYESMQLFSQVAGMSKPGFLLTENEYSSAARICRLVEGMPLGIEIAASWVHTFTVDKIAVEIERSLTFLNTSRREVLPRHRSMTALFDSFWQVLSDLEQQVIAQLAVFNGGFRREAARQVAGVSTLFLDALIAKAFLHQASTGRYEMHELLRQYGVEKLGKDAVFELQTRENHSAFYLTYIQGQSVEWVSEEIDNVRAAWQWALEHNLSGLNLQAVDGLKRYYELAGLWDEGVQALEAALTRLNRGRQSGDLSLDEQTLSTSLRACQGLLLTLLARYDQAIAVLELARRGSESLHNQVILGQVLAQMGDVFHHKGDFLKAREYLEQGLLLAQAEKNPGGEAFALDRLGYVFWAQGDYDQARPLAERALALYRSLGDKLTIASSLNGLGLIVESQGNLAEGRAMYEETLTLHREIGDKHGLAISLINLGDTLTSQGDYTAARMSIEEGLGLSREMGFKRLMNIALLNLGGLAIEQGKALYAQAFFLENLALSQDMGEKIDVIYSISGLAAAAAMLSNPSRAVRLAAAADTQRLGMGAAWDLLEGRIFQRTLNLLQTGLSDTEFKTAWTAGEKMTLDEAAALASVEA